MLFHDEIVVSNLINMLVYLVISILPSVHSHCRISDLIKVEDLLEKTRTRCDKEEATQGTGPASNVTSHCIQDPNFTKSFYYNISWKPPKYSGTDVDGYQVYVMYSINEYACFISRIPM